jgi:hypothetical protein
MLDQTSLGNRFLMQEFNFTPRVSWQLDPFGHSATQVPPHARSPEPAMACDYASR